MNLEKINLSAAELKLCNHCLGRIYGMLGHHLTNDERGRAIRIIYAMEKKEDVKEVEGEECAICGGIFSRIDDYAKYAANILKEIEFSTFSVGSRFPAEVVEMEKEIQEKYAPEGAGEYIGREFNRELGKRISEITGKEANLENPEVTVIIDTEYDDFRVEIKPLFIYGRYRKLVRGIPQTKWPSGKYRESVEEIIAKPFMELTKGEEHALHGMGREDIDVRMLGNGRPFVLEIKRPKRRTLNLKEIEKEINENSDGKVEVTGLRYSNRKEVVKIKTAKPKKRYRIGVSVETNEEEIKGALEKLKVVISQRTPTRVAHRRADRIRKRRVYDIKLVDKRGDTWIIDVLAESGTYIKELMHGDSGRTRPSLAEILNKEVKVDFLDVIEILD